MKGVEYVAVEPLSPALFVIQKRNRTAYNEAYNLEDYYIHGGNIYQAPDLRSILENRLVNNLHYLHTAFNRHHQNVVWNPSTGYTLKTVDPSTGSGITGRFAADHMPDNVFNRIFNIANFKYYHQEYLAINAPPEEVPLSRREDSLPEKLEKKSKEQPFLVREDSLVEKFSLKMSINEKGKPATVKPNEGNQTIVVVHVLYCMVLKSLSPAEGCERKKKLRKTRTSKKRRK
ncbi:15728_t:CDS:2 [Acaulospora colombiana]|uniref:15728_t:CDS:1 n=1 Tax=Acaulospora colombiana TaxID=27376 RepID=A0ACA9K5A0_9GLOM|nr:15728_t:CDS:2 [Acaulospora colombiana]